MNAAEDFLLLLLHTHVVAAADAIQANITSVESVAELAKLIVVNYLLLPQDDKGFDDASVCGDEVQRNYSLWHCCGMGFMTPVMERE